MKVGASNGWLIIMTVKYGLEDSLKDHLASAATVELNSVIIGQMASICTAHKGTTVLFLRCLV